MRRALLRIALCLPAFLVVAGSTAGQEDAARTQRTDRGVQRERSHQRHDRDDLKQRRERWTRKSAREREILMRRYQELQRLTPEERQELVQRAQRLEEIRQSLRETAPEDLKKEIDSLDPGRRERRWREHMVERSREMGRHLREEMPPEFRKRLENASPEERQRMLEHFARNQEEASRRAIRGMGRMLDLSPDEVRRLEALPLAERLATLMRLKRKMITERIQAQGLPSGLDEPTWQRLEKLSDEEFLQHMHAILPFDRQRWRSPRERDGRDWRRDRGDRAEDFSRNRRRGERFQGRDR